VISAACIKSGHLLPLTADGADADFFHIFRTVFASLWYVAVTLRPGV